MNEIRISPIGKIVNGKEIKVVLDPKYIEALKGLEGYGHVQILWWMNGCDNETDRNLLVERSHIEAVRMKSVYSRLDLRRDLIR